MGGDVNQNQTERAGGIMTAPDARMGIILSSGNLMVEPYLRAFAPAGLGVHVTRMRMASEWKRSPAELAADVITAAELLADAKVDVIIYQATGVAMANGPEAEAELIARITKATGTPALSASQAIVEALRALGVRKTVVVSPFDQSANSRERPYLEAQGFQVVHEMGLGMKAGPESATVAPARWVETVAANARDDADGYFLSGSNTTMAEAVAAIEHKLGKPVVSSVQATLWAGVRRLAPKLGPVTFPAELGRLFGSL